jgi:ABC-type phosphate/phosphonate transport system substrate-binding protein
LTPFFRLFASGLFFASAATGVAAADRVAFVGVALDQETRDADRLLQDYLQRSSNISFAPEELEYSQVIERLSNWTPDQGLFVARTTPYVQVVAEMLGADMEVLATYVSEATGRTTYHSYFVMRKERLPSNPTPADVVAFIAAQPERARFIYHSLFSTSSFFVPSLHFRANGVFHMPESTESLVAIDARLIDENSSSALVRAVARGEADVAAVWDGTRARFVEGGTNPSDVALGRGLAMVRLPSTIPNDLLVCPRWAPQEFKDGIRSAIKNMPSGGRRLHDLDRHRGRLAGAGRPGPAPLAREGTAGSGDGRRPRCGHERGHLGHGRRGQARGTPLRHRIRALRRRLPRAH